MASLLWALLSFFAHGILSQSCFPQGPCDEGYMDQTNGNYNNWACGENCVGGTYYTDGVCGCACIPESDDCSPAPAAYGSTPAPISCSLSMSFDTFGLFPSTLHGPVLLVFSILVNMHCARTDADYSIGCDERLTGYMGYGDSVTFQFTNTAVQVCNLHI